MNGEYQVKRFFTARELLRVLSIAIRRQSQLLQENCFFVRRWVFVVVAVSNGDADGAGSRVVLGRTGIDADDVNSIG